MATYQPNTLAGGFHPITNAILGLSRAFGDPSATIAGQKARQDADYNVARISETNANTKKLDAARFLDEQKFSGRAGLEGAISGAFNPDGSINQQRLAATLGTLAQGDQLGNADKVLSLSQLFSVNPGEPGYDDAARRSLIAGGHMPDQNFAATAGRADTISARDAGEALRQAVQVQGMQDATSRANNKLDNETSIINNTADNTQLGANNQLDNETSIANNAADNAARTADGQKPLYTAFSDEGGNVYTFDTHAPKPTFTPALGADGKPLVNFNKIGTPGRGSTAAPKVYSLSPTQLDDFLGAVPDIGSALGYGDIDDAIVQAVADRAAEIYGSSGNSQTAITQAYSELVEKGEGGSSFFGLAGNPPAVLKAAPISGAIVPAGPTAAAVPQATANIQQLAAEARDAIAKGADPVAVAARYKQQTGQELQ